MKPLVKVSSGPFSPLSVGLHKIIHGPSAEEISRIVPPDHQVELEFRMEKHASGGPMAWGPEKYWIYTIDAWMDVDTLKWQDDDSSVRLTGNIMCEQTLIPVIVMYNTATRLGEMWTDDDYERDY